MSNESETDLRAVADQLKIRVAQVEATAKLLGEGATVPFIARYRKEATGSLDEVAIIEIRDRLASLQELHKRHSAIVESLQERSLLSDDLAKKLAAAQTLTELEDLYLPYRPKRKTRATAAKEKGLEPLATLMILGKAQDPEAEAKKFISEEKGVATAEDALAGARDIIAEIVSEDIETRKQLRNHWMKKARIASKVAKGKETEGARFSDYFNWQEEAARAPSHRILALLRGETEGVLKLEIEPEAEPAVRTLEGKFVRGNNKNAEQLKLAIADSYKRLIAPSLETELRNELKTKADDEAIRVFAKNLRELLLAPPLGQKFVLALDPGFRTGCKVVCLDRQGALLHNDVIYPHTGQEKKAAEQVLTLCKKYAIEAIAIGNGTASRETEAFVGSIDFSSLPQGKPQVIMVNESGASIYSASEVAREEFPSHDVTVRGAVSIGRRLTDPLAELVKIDPKSIGVGQYQHDVNQTALKQSLDDVVISCVNSVGVEVNTASKQLLSYVSGLGPQLAGNIVKHRCESGPFKSRAELKKVPRLGPKAYEQAAGFLRIRESANPLDASAVHPESYEIVEKMAKDLKASVADLIRDAELRKRIDLQKYVTDKVGMPTLNDILNELAKPGRDPRPKLEQVKFADGISTLEDLRPGMKLPGVVTNVTAFGAFVDIGVHQDGLVHVSELANKFVKDPSEVVRVQQQVQVTVMSVDKDRKRIALSMKR